MAKAKLKPEASDQAKNMFDVILAVVRRVPHGKVSTYGDIAYAAGFPGSARQVAWALNQGRIGIPWQRIVGAGGKILLPAERGFEQRMRLQQEGVAFIGLKVNMKVHQAALSQIKAHKKKRAVR
jgi:methylated-DNA-protein-cysteine methyltransferase related protein